VRRSLAILLISACSIIGSSGAAGAQALPNCVAVGQVVEGTLSATGHCTLRRSVGPDGSESEITCKYDYLFNDSEVAIYQRSPGVYSSGSDNGSTIIVTSTEVIIGATTGSGLEFETVTLQGGARQFSSTGRWYRRFCSDADGLIAIDGPFPSGPTKSVADVIEEASASLRPVAPDAINHSGPGSIVQLATFFWLEGVDFEGGFLTSQSSHGNLVVAVQAQPSEFFFEVDGVRYDCGARNTPWTRGLDENNPDVCTHTFNTAPASGTSIEMDLVVVYATTWSANVGGLGGDLVPIQARTNGIPHQVFEVVGLARDR
jgi:hypothetical protein